MSPAMSEARVFEVTGLLEPEFIAKHAVVVPRPVLVMDGNEDSWI